MWTASGFCDLKTTDRVRQATDNEKKISHVDETEWKKDLWRNFNCLENDKVKFACAPRSYRCNAISRSTYDAIRECWPTLRMHVGAPTFFNRCLGIAPFFQPCVILCSPYLSFPRATSHGSSIFLSFHFLVLRLV